MQVLPGKYEPSITLTLRFSNSKIIALASLRETKRLFVIELETPNPRF
jgi:hypothetical protein